ncbi:MAG: NAD(P)/FAD-dependent oxidoreductase [Nitrospirales bacterium]|nr:NAD(P)/FAD-dependent oxidoreductase [Nitrospirales bacterium]
MAEERIYDSIIIGAGPGGLQAAIYLGRYNRDVLLIDRNGGRTWHAKHIENFLSQKLITGEEIVTTGMEQARSFRVRIERGHVTSVTKREHFDVHTETDLYHSLFVIVSTGVYDILPPLENLYPFFGTSFFTCIDCDGYRTTGKKLVILGDDIEAVLHAFAMKEMFTRDITVVLDSFPMPPEYEEELRGENIRCVTGRPVRLAGDTHLEAVELDNRQRIACEVIISTYGCRMNDDFLSGLPLKRDPRGYFITDSHYESSLGGLYIVGPLNTGPDQVVIAAGEGAAAAIELNKRLIERRKMAYFLE